MPCVWFPAHEQPDSPHALTTARPVFGSLYLAILARMYQCNLDLFVYRHLYAEISRTQ
jgi:hypothetical protein